jgi:lipoprotein-anchoring transpeptidase ErfK/SrfK
MDQRTTRSGGPERRDHAPPGRLRRILFDYRGATLALITGVAALAILFVATTAWAVNERFKRDVSEIAYTHDARALRFLAERENKSTAALANRVASLEQQSAALVPEEAPYLVVSLEEKRVWYLKGQDTLFTAPVAVGSGKTMVLGGKTKRFQTPRGKMSITHKELDPVWVPPNWHYHEIARKRGLQVVDMSNAPRNALAGFPPGKEPIADGKIYIPPWGSPQRRHTGVLGAAKLEMYDGYYFHGTDNEASIGTAASHGCIRMLKDDVLWMYENVPVDTPVYIY